MHIIYIYTYIHIQILHEYHYISFIIWNTGNSKIPVVNPCFPYKPISIPRVVATVFWSRAWFIVTSSRSQAPSSPGAQHRIQANGTKICILMYTTTFQTLKGLMSQLHVVVSYLSQNHIGSNATLRITHCNTWHQVFGIESANVTIANRS